MVSISVIIATLRSRDKIEAIQVVKEHSFDDYEIIICDETPVTRARNEGIKRATADKLVFLDDDSRPQPGYLEKACTVLETQAAYTGRTIHPFDDVFSRHFTDHYNWGDEPCYVKYFWGCNMGVHRSVFESVGGWDEQMGWGHEEKELASRVTSDFDIRYDPELVVKHPYTTSITNYWQKQYKLETQTPYYWSKRNIPQEEQVRTILCHAINPLNYVRRTPIATVTAAGGMLAKTAGRIKGLIDRSRRSDSVSGSVPVIEGQAESPCTASQE